MVNPADTADPAPLPGTASTASTVDTVVRSAPARAHPRDGRQAPRWAVIAAHLVPLVTLPSGLWRLPVAAGYFPGSDSPVDLSVGFSLYVVGLSVVAEALALLTIGLVRPWGERMPAWIPVLGGRRIPPFAAIVPAALGTIALTVVWGQAFWGMADFGSTFTHPAWLWLFVACYAPVLLWAPLLGAVTYAYYRRRCRD